VYAGTYGNGVAKSTDNGQTWNLVNNGLNNSGVTALLSTDSTTFNLLAGTNGVIYFTANGGSSWTERINLGSTVYAFAMSTTTGTIFAATDNGIYRASGPGGTWTLANNGLTTFAIRSIVVERISGNIYAGTLSDGVFRSTDNGGTWKQVGTPVAVFALKALGNRVLAGTNDSMFATENSGLSWQQSNSGIPSSIISSIADDYSLNATYAATFSGIYLSGNKGMTWVYADSGMQGNRTRSLAIASGTRVLAGTLTNGVFVKTALGTTWAQSNLGLTDLSVTSTAYSLPFDQFYIGTLLGGVFRGDASSSITWEQVNSGLPAAMVTAVYAGNAPNIIFAGMQGAGIFRSTNMGQSWTATTAASSSDVNQFIQAKNGFYAATLGDGVLFSSDDGVTWSKVNTGLGSLTVYSLALDDADYLWAGTLDGGVYRSQANTSGVRTLDAVTSTVYPTPASKYITVTAPQHSSIDICDHLGRVRYSAQLTEDHLRVDVSDLRSGSYFLHVTNNNSSTVHHLVIAR
jgi:photosystem II stability/assembly factor-like uncharacterized protein